MKKILLLLIIAIGAFFIYKFVFKKEKASGKEATPLTVSKHSEAFNASVATVLKDYFAMADGFVQWDTLAVHKNATALQQSLSAFKADELKKDTAIYQTILFPWDNAKNSVAAIVAASDWNSKRRALQDLSDNLRMLLITIQYDRAITYWQECPMAFGEGQSGNWLSAKEEVTNPYLGEKDPQYGATMLHCGETKMSIDFTKADTTTAK